MGTRQAKNGYISGTVVETSSSTVITFPPQDGADGKAGVTYCLIGEEGDHGYKCIPYKFSVFRYIILVLLYFLTLGFLWLVYYWRPDWKLKFTHSKCTLQDKYNSVLLLARDGTDRVFVSEVKHVQSDMKSYAPHLFSGKNTSRVSYQNSGYQNSASAEGLFETVVFFKHQYLKYVWEESRQTFIEVEGFDGHMTLRDLHDVGGQGLTVSEQENARNLYGDNVIHVEVPSYLALLLSEVLNPFYVFQFFACAFWMADEYYAYATAIIIMSTISAIISLITVRRERQSLHDMVELHNSAKVTVVRETVETENSDVPSTSGSQGSSVHYETEEIWVKDLVPGDVVVIPPSGCSLSYDAVLLSGTCIVNESMLTGESVPITKTTLPSGESDLKKVYSVTKEKSHTLFCGTDILQTRYYRDELVRAVVVRTGFHTAKGMLVHSILFPKPVDLRLLRDAYRFVGVMCAIAILGFIYSTVLQIQNGESVKDILFKSIDIITITVPPALPLAMTIGILYAQTRLKNQRIHTISPQRINICGQVDVVAFDKTGTLTEDGLDLSYIVKAESDKFASPLSPDEVSELDLNSEIIRCMATCHSLTLIDRKISGDPLEVKMFEATGWELVEPSIEDEAKYEQLECTYVSPPVEHSTLRGNRRLRSKHELGIIRQFPFLSSLQRASVIVKPSSSGPKDMMAYVKGAPETIAPLCNSVPSDFHEFLKSFTKQGHRVIALACKPVNIAWHKAQKIEREAIEKDLQFLGFMVLQNKLKPHSIGVIKDLDKAMIRSLMVTGDNLETAITVARECGLLKSNVPLLVAKSETFEMDDTPTLMWEMFYGNGRCDDHLYDNGKGGYRSPLSSSTESDILSPMVNMGDNTGPYKCQLAVTGREFQTIQRYFPEFLPALAVQGTVFARMSPQQKTELMEELEAVDYHILMCGDGANDCGALKRAHVGLSLSEYDASVAAPFTASGENSINSVPTLIREGRAALVTSFGMFKFMALYSLIQFTTVLLLYRSESNLSDYQFLYIDLIIIDAVAVTMSRNHAHKSLHWKKPSSSLVSVEMLVSLLLQILLQFGLQILAYVLVQNQCWFKTPTLVHHSDLESESLNTTVSPLTTIAEATTANYSSCPPAADVPDMIYPDDEYQWSFPTTSLFFISSFMYMSTSVAFSRGPPFRTAIYKNRLYLLSLLILTGFTLFLMFGAPPELEHFMMLLHIPDLTFLFVLTSIAFGHFIVALLIEIVFIENAFLWNCIKERCQCFRKSQQKRYKTLAMYLSGEAFVGLGDTEVGIEEDFKIPSQLVGQVCYPRMDNLKLEDAYSYKTRL